MINYRYVEDINNLNVKEFCVDIHIDYLLVFSARVDLHAHALYKSGHVIIQDKVSVTYHVVLVLLCVFLEMYSYRMAVYGFRICMPSLMSTGQLSAGFRASAAGCITWL